MVGAPRFDTSFWYSKALWQAVEALEDEFCGYMSLIFTEDFVTEVLFKVFSDNEYDFSESSLDSVVDRIVHDGFTIGSQTVELFQSTITAAHAGSEQK